MINHANETLQQFFMQRTMRAEMDMYAEEGVRVPQIELPDNAACVALVQDKPSGLFWLIEDEGSVPKASDASLTERILTTHAAHGSLAPPGGGPNGRRSARAAAGGTRFVVAHFAGSVEYECRGFLGKNVDALHAELPILLEV